MMRVDVFGQRISGRLALISGKISGNLPGVGWSHLAWNMLPSAFRRRAPRLDLQVLSETESIQHIRSQWGDFAIPKPGEEVLNSLLLEICRLNAYENHDIFLENGDVVVDCGAHVGVFARFALQRGASRVWCVEMEKTNFACLQENLKDFPDRVEFFPSALWKEDRVLELMVGACSDCHSVRESSSVAPSAPVHAKTLDQLLSANPPQRVDFLKIDVEGREPEVLLGAEQTLRTFRPKLAVAVYHDAPEEGRVRKIIRTICPDYTFSYKLLCGPVVSILFGRRPK